MQDYILNTDYSVRVQFGCRHCCIQWIFIKFKKCPYDRATFFGHRESFKARYIDIYANTSFQSVKAGRISLQKRNGRRVCFSPMNSRAQNNMSRRSSAANKFLPRQQAGLNKTMAVFFVWRFCCAQNTLTRLAFLPPLAETNGIKPIPETAEPTSHIYS